MLFFFFAFVLGGTIASARPPVFEDVDSTYFIGGTIVYSQDSARKICESRSSGLMKIESLLELAEITYKLDPLSDYWGYNMWVDGVFNKHTLKWHWTGGELIQSFPGLWCEGYPIEIDPVYLHTLTQYGQQCATLRSTKNSTWYLVNVDCHAATHYICEYYPTPLHPSNVNIRLINNDPVSDAYVGVTPAPRSKSWHHGDQPYVKPTEPAVVYENLAYRGKQTFGDIEAIFRAIGSVFFGIDED